MKLPAQREWKNTSVLCVVTLGTMPILEISSEQKSIEKDLTLNVYTKYSLNSYTVSLRFLRKKYAEKCFRIWKTYLVEKRMWLNKWVWKPVIFMGSTVYLGYLQYNWKGIKKLSVTFYFKNGRNVNLLSL